MRSLYLFLVLGLFAGCQGSKSFGPFQRSLNTAEYGYRLIDDPTGSAPTQRVERFEVRPGDCGASNGWSDCATNRERSELSERTKTVRSGTYWYGWSFFIPEDYVNVFPTKTAIGQFHQEGGHPLWMFQNSFGGYWLDKQVIGVTESYHQLIAPEDFKGRWHQIEVHVNWSAGPDGFLYIWVNGEKRFEFQGQTAKGKPVYFKYGIYRSYLSRYKNSFKKAEVPGQILYFDNVRRGSKREDLQVQ